MNTYPTYMRSVTCGAEPDEGGTHYLEQVLAFEVQDNAGKGAAPEWIQIFPAGPKLPTHDGRSFRISDPQKFVAAQKISKDTPIMVDYDHLSSFAPGQNGNQTAAGWINELAVRNGEVWGRAEWTARAARQIADREYRYISPEFMAHKRTGEAIKLDAVALATSIETYAWLAQISGMKKWIDERRIKRLNVEAYTLKNEKFEDTVAVRREAIEDDQLGTYSTCAPKPT